jgi:hypothetical protein
MSADTNTGGPAFPVAYGGGRIEGMTLRDYFAAKAMLPLMQRSGGYWDKENMHGYAVVAYEMADAMLKARQA